MNRTTISEMGFATAGIHLIDRFVSKPQLEAINAEIDLLLSKPSTNGNAHGVYIRPGYYAVAVATLSIRSTNLLELALRVRDAFVDAQPSLKGRNYKLTMLNIYSEQRNPAPLFWHTDNRKGMLRAQIYLRGGQKDSGAFWYMVGSHNRDYVVEHRLSEKMVDDLSATIYRCEEPAGALVCFDSYGFHAKAPCVKDRRTIFLELQPEGTDFKKSTIYLSSGDLTPTVLANIDFFVNGHPKNVFEHGDDEYLRKETPLPAADMPRLFLAALKSWSQTTPRLWIPTYLRSLLKKVLH